MKSSSDTSSEDFFSYYWRLHLFQLYTVFPEGKADIKVSRIWNVIVQYICSVTDVNLHFFVISYFL